MIKVVLIPKVEPFTMVKGRSKFNYLKPLIQNKEMTLYKLINMAISVVGSCRWVIEYALMFYFERRCIKVPFLII